MNMTVDTYVLLGRLGWGEKILEFGRLPSIVKVTKRWNKGRECMGKVMEKTNDRKVLNTNVAHIYAILFHCS